MNKKNKKQTEERQIEIKPEERNLAELIQVFKANIAAPRCQWPLNPDAILTKGNMTYLVEILEEKYKEKVKRLLAEAIYNDGVHHKQWYLWQIAAELGIDLSDEWGEQFPEPDKGIAP